MWKNTRVRSASCLLFVNLSFFQNFIEASMNPGKYQLLILQWARSEVISRVSRMFLSFKIPQIILKFSYFFLQLNSDLRSTPPQPLRIKSSPKAHKIHSHIKRLISGNTRANLKQRRLCFLLYQNLQVQKIAEDIEHTRGRVAIHKHKK